MIPKLIYQAVANNQGRFIGFVLVTQNKYNLPKGWKLQGQPIKVLVPEQK